MIVKGKYKYEYSTINLRVKVAKRFRKFSKKIAKTHSETLNVIIDFFEWHGFSPADKFERSIIQEVVKNRKRTEATIAIIRDIEKSQTKPTNAMLQSLFIEKLEEEEPVLVEKKFEAEKSENKVMEHTVPKIRYERLEEKMKALKKDFEYMLENIKPVKASFGKGYLKLELTPEEIERFKRIIKKL